MDVRLKEIVIRAVTAAVSAMDGQDYKKAGDALDVVAKAYIAMREASVFAATIHHIQNPPAV